MRRSGFFGIGLLILLTLLIGGVAYNWGVAAGQTQVLAGTPGTAPGTVYYPTGYAHPFGFGFGIIGIVFFFLIVGLIVSAFRGRAWGGGGRRGWSGGMGPGGWGQGGPGGRGWGGPFADADGHGRSDVPPAFQPMLESWHRRAHGDSSDPASSTPPSTAAPGSAPDAPGGR